jgi:DNA-binding winged helix-turn-helix (wHTH) protein
MIATFKYLALFLGLTALVVLGGSAVWRPTPKSNADAILAENLNLALRYTGDRLLDLAGDQHSRIEPVKRLGRNTWLLKLERHFEYDSLPPVLHRSMLRHQINRDYNVAVLRCQDGELMLGYKSSDYLDDPTVPCGGRDQETACLNLQITLLDEPGSSQGEPVWWMTLGLLAGVISTFLWWKNRPQHSPKLFSPPDQAANLMHFSQTYFDYPNQKIWVKGQEKDLTLREAQLLNYLFQHHNQALERERILQDIWGDEDLLIGRSLDVFVSRLRKLLREDEGIRISSVHGVGYRMELKGQSSNS